MYSTEPCNFAKKHTEPVYSYFSQAANRRKMCSSAVEKAKDIEDIFAALRQHKDEKNPLCKASVGSPCMHYGGMVGDHTTQSLAVEWDSKGEMLLWATGSSMPCVSLFKPFVFYENPAAPVFLENEINAKDYWMEAEYFHRSLLGYKLPAEYYAERDAIEQELVKLSRNLKGPEMLELSKLALEKECEFIGKWKNVKLEKGRTSALFSKNWKMKNEKLNLF